MNELTPEEIQQAIEVWKLPRGLTYYPDQGFFSKPNPKANYEWEIHKSFGIQLLANHIEAELAKEGRSLQQTSIIHNQAQLSSRKPEQWPTEWVYCDPTNPLSRAIALIRASLEVKP